MRRRALTYAATIALIAIATHALAQDRVWRIAVLGLTDSPTFRTVALAELAQLGFMEGRNIVVETRIGGPERLPVLAKESFALALTSPLQRARDSCRLAGLGDRASIEPDLVEWNYGSYEGLTPGQIHAAAPGWLLFRDGGPGGEQPREIGARVDRVIE